MHATVFSGTILGVDGLTVEVEVDLSRGIPTFSIVGLPNTAVRESRERVTAAIKNSGREFPLERITVNLAPADIKKEGAAFDLAVAVGILMASAKKKAEDPDDLFCLPRTLFVGELALDGSLRRVRGVLPILLHAKEEGFECAVVPYENFAESLVVAGVTVYAARRLTDVLDVVGRIDRRAGDRGESAPLDPSDVRVKEADRVRDVVDAGTRDGDGALDMDDVRGQETVKRGLLVAAAGGHHVLMAGPPGAGKTMLARRFSSILPPLDEREALETTRIYSTAGLLDGEGLITRSPFRSPHHSASDAGLIGGGNVPRPGEITLAHNGVLFLDELPEFKRHVLETLREPLEEGRITISRARHAVTFPARFQLVAAMNPCPCGNLGTASVCQCAPGAVERYLAKISGPLLDRIAIHVFVRPVELEAFGASDTRRDESGSMRSEVVRARDAQRRRFTGSTVSSNARMPERMLRTVCRLEPPGEMLLLQAQKKLRISARGRSHILRVARTIADLEGAERIAAEHVAEAVQYRMREFRV